MLADMKSLEQRVLGASRDLHDNVRSISDQVNEMKLESLMEGNNNELAIEAIKELNSKGGIYSSLGKDLTILEVLGMEARSESELCRAHGWARDSIPKERTCVGGRQDGRKPLHKQNNTRRATNAVNNSFFQAIAKVTNQTPRGRRVAGQGHLNAMVYQIMPEWRRLYLALSGEFAAPKHY